MRHHSHTTAVSLNLVSFWVASVTLNASRGRSLFHSYGFCILIQNKTGDVSCETLLHKTKSRQKASLSPVGQWAQATPQYQPTRAAMHRVTHSV